MQVSFGASLHNGLSSPKGKQIFQAVEDLLQKDPAISVVGDDKFTPDVEFKLKDESKLTVQSKTYTGTIPFNGDITTDPAALEHVAQEMFNVLAGRIDPGDGWDLLSRVVHRFLTNPTPDNKKALDRWSGRSNGYFTARKGTP